MSATPVRIQLSRRKGFNLQEVSKALNGLEAVNVCRPTIYGNPFVHDDAAVAVEAYERHCRGTAHRRVPALRPSRWRQPVHL